MKNRKYYKYYLKDLFNWTEKKTFDEVDFSLNYGIHKFTLSVTDTLISETF